MATAPRDDAPGSAPQGDSPLLDFADVPRKQFEELVGQLTARAEDVLRSQGRLRGLLRASAAVASDLSLPVVLRQVAAAARDLVEARYAALGVLGRDGRLEEFVHVGMDAELVQQIGPLPQGRGVLGYLITHPNPVRLADMSDHPAAAGFPLHHPPMHSFLGVPITVRGQVFGNLYLADSASGEFSAEDEQCVVALAATAGVAIANARLYQETVQQRQWLVASTELTQQMLAEGAEEPVDALLRHARHCAKADMAMLALPISDDTARVSAAAGAPLDALAGRLVPLDATLTGHVIRSGKAVLVNDGMSGFESIEIGDIPQGIGTVIGVPVLDARDRVLGALTVARVHGGVPFSEMDRDQLAAFAGQAGIAMELDRARGDRETARQGEDHDRIAADLHDHVIQELFTTGMGLQGMIGRLASTDQRERIEGYVDALDATIRRIRSTIFRLQPGNHPQAGLQRRLLLVLDEEQAALGFAPGIAFTGALDLRVHPGMADDIVAVTREALSNIARHANATTADVQIALIGESVTLDVIDNGSGILDTTRSSGLTNMRRRAAIHNGIFELSEPPGGGTHLHWTALLT